MQPLLDVQRLSVAFGSDQSTRAVVRDISFSIATGEVLGLVGESGSGKSVTSLAVLRLLSPQARVTGSIRFAGIELLSLSDQEMRTHRGSDIAMIFQEPMTALNPVMRVGRQIAESVLAHQPRLGRAQVRERVIEAVEAVSVSPERMGDYPHQFSGGQRQRIMIAMALVNRPRLLIADEPTTALDVTVQAQILALLGSLRRRFDLAILFISHDLAVVGGVADRVAVMRSGELLEIGARDQIFRQPQHLYTRRLLAAVPTLRTDRNAPLATVASISEPDTTRAREAMPDHALPE